MSEAQQAELSADYLVCTSVLQLAALMVVLKDANSVAHLAEHSDYSSVVEMVHYLVAN